LPRTIARSVAEADPVAQAVREPYGYVRVSTILQRLKGYSLPKQLKAVAAAAVADENPIAPENLLGDADSGRKSERKGLQTLLTRAREGRVSVVYFAKVDRIGRNARDSLNIVHELKRLGVRMVVLDPRLDTDDPFGYFLFVILAAMAELEATFILERTMGGKLEKLIQDEEMGAQHLRRGATPPMGYATCRRPRRACPGRGSASPSRRGGSCGSSPSQPGG
jgi:DNA invertase Pin-like site-specific DNA recombinase